MSDRPALLWYCQHSVGLGHLIRSYALCAALAERFRVVLLCGGALPDGDPAAGRRRRCSRCRRSGVGADGGFVSHDPRYSLERGVGRAARAHPRRLPRGPPGRGGRRAVPVRAREVRPRARAAARGRARRRRARPPAACATSSSARAPTSRRTTTAPPRSRTRHLDAVLVHSDPRFARLEETFAPRAPLRVPVHYTGFVVRDGRGAAPRRAASTSWCRRAGGLVGEPLLRAAAEAQPAAGVPLRLIGGPLLPDAAWERLRALAGPEVELRRTVRRPRRRARAAPAPRSARAATTPRSRSCPSGVPGLLVPYATPEEDEQLRRARRLERLGAVRVLAPERLVALDARPPSCGGCSSFEPRAGERRPRRRAADRATCSRTS